MSLSFITVHESHINALSFTAHKEKDCPYFSHINTIKFKNKICFYPNASQFMLPQRFCQPVKLNHHTISLMVHTIHYTLYTISLYTLKFIHITQISQKQNHVRRSSLQKTNFEFNNLQPSQLLNRLLHSLPYSPDIQHFLQNFKHQYSEVTDDEYLKLCSLLIKYKHYYATHRNDDGETATLSRIRSNQILFSMNSTPESTYSL